MACSADAQALAADIYEALELWPLAADAWFRFLDTCNEADFGEGYEGLAVAFMNMGNDVQSALYYHRAFAEEGQISPEGAAELGGLFRRATGPALHIVPDDDEIRNDKVNAVVSRFASIPEVRRFLFEYQRRQKDVARERGFAGLIMDGRDIGSVIFPDADLRIFLTADPEARARRRAAEGIADSVAERDKLDASRKTAPLACPEGAVKIDSTHLTLEEVVAKISAMISAL